MVVKSIPRSVSLCVAAAMFLAAPAAYPQLAHKGPAAAIALSQTLAPYDVVSIRLHDESKDSPNQSSFNLTIGDDILTATNLPLEMLLEFAYDIRSDQISGLSGQVESAHFDIEAKVLPNDAGTQPKRTDAQLSAMIITLLADRFHLKAHLQPKTLPVYDLVVNRGGPKIKLSQADRTGASWGLDWTDNSKVLTAKSASMADLATALADGVHREVIDKTGLTGGADITLKWSDDVAQEQGGPDVISIFTAVEEQLGLKLQPAKGPVDTLVIDHVEMPTGN